MFGLLGKNPAFRTLWTAQVVSQAGDWFNRIAVLALIGQLGGERATLGLGGLYAFELAVRLLPSAFFGPFAGTFADRFARRGLMIASDLARAGVVLAMILVDEPGELPWLYALLVLQMGLGVFFEAASSGSLPNTVAPPDLHSAFALSAATWSTMLTVGTLLGALAIRFIHIQGMFVADALSYLVSAWILMGLRLPPMPVQAEPFRWRDVLMFADLRRGLDHARARGAMPGILAKTFWAPAGGFLVMLSVAGRERFAPLAGEVAGSLDETHLAAAAGSATAVLLAGRGLGTGFGPILARRLFGSSDRALLRVTFGGFGVAAVGYALFASMPALLPAAACVLVAHLGGGSLWVSSTTFWQKHIDDSFRGRVRTLEFLASTITFSLGGAVGGLCYDATGSIPFAIWTLCALVVLLGLTWGVLVRRDRARATASAARTSVGGPA